MTNLLHTICTMDWMPTLAVVGIVSFVFYLIVKVSTDQDDHTLIK